VYVVIRRYKGVSRETSNEVAALSHARFRERLRQRPGFVAYELVIGDDGITAISAFENWVVAEETTLMARKWNQDELAEFHLPEPEVITGEVHIAPGLPPPFAPPRAIRVRRPLENLIDAREG
jgi:hypothetical protein